MSTATTTLSNYSAPLTFPEVEKFDGTNWLQWSKTILIAARLQGACSYLEGTIPNPAAHPLAAPIPPSPSTTTPAVTTTTAPLPTAALTPWTYTLPTAEEWDTRDAWAMGLITWNIKDTNMIGLGVKTDRTAAQAWTSLTSQYQTMSDLAAVLADTELRNIKLCDSNDLHTHIANLCLKWAHVNSHVSRNNTVATPNTTATTLQADAKQKKLDKHCTNCHRRGHTNDVCYWLGGGKAGQFLPSFGQRGGASGSTSTPAPLASTPTVTASAAIVKTAYALMAMTGRGDKGGRTTEYTVSSILKEDEPMALATMALGGGELLTYIDSGASDHCFANKIDFSTYEPFYESCKGQAACQGAKFKILGKGTVEKTFISEGCKTTIMFHEALHTPEFAANLISVSKFDAARFKVVFGEGHTQFVDPDGKTFITANCTSGMYLLSQRTGTSTLSAKSHEKPTGIDTWH
ncbi:hypothetical protein NLJ89_g10542 [Agrocybe chaxingu]|uniref:Retrovirus-related Pol polyprotein from transposon TNT 1-94-like beta-barrel domain-containing protein n=1 Tax=Agrocybe chaxingu TaxID=84603 RepID=A0A9W8MQ67_9AGAR|nr:hypothetical protein NLJ89_g10542 [Agrocybe chaxingu]